MANHRTGRLAAIALAGALVATGCGADAGSDPAGAVSTETAQSGTSGRGQLDCATGALTASGSSAQANAIAAWANAYQGACPDATIDYQPNGSGAGVQDFINAQTAFAGSDSALSSAEKAEADARCAAGPAIDLPVVGGAVVAAYRVDGVESLVLTPQLLAGIFADAVTRWNAPEIAAANPGVALPDAPIVHFHRSDSSGTTDNFTKYLSATAADAWTFPGGKDWSAPGGQGAKGSDGVANAVASTPNSIGYLELSYARSAGLRSAAIDNGAGPVEATSASAARTISQAEVVGSGHDLVLSLDYATKAPGAYPLVLVTYEIACERGGDPETAQLTKSFLSYVVSDAGQSVLEEIGYVPVEGALLDKVRAAVDAMSV